MDIIDKIGPNGKKIVLITTLSLLTISIILSISALSISLSSQPPQEKKSAVFENDDVILETGKYKWRFTESKDGGLCFYATGNEDNKTTSKSCIDVKTVKSTKKGVEDNYILHLNNFST